MKLQRSFAAFYEKLRFRCLLEERGLAEDILKPVNTDLTRKGRLLKQGGIVDATIAAAPSGYKPHPFGASG